ncbi:MAG: hypothetical protein KJ995_05165 [Candidatus Omnitrophica bacterium]|nr:hypothetical protein [Candidatus Omnitrophota bacterium]MBU1851777.1 hypothetical protein [Candidatus Omnitrophota bacterium]
MIKNKHFKVILFSSFIVVVVMLSVLIGYGIYLQWKEDAGAAQYQSFLRKVTAGMWRDEIVIYNAAVKPGEDDGASGMPEGMPVLDGKIRNNSGKTITSMMLEVVFSRPDGFVIYRDWFYPLDRDVLSRSPFFSGRKRKGAVLAAGEYMSFRHAIGNCPSAILEQIHTKGVFAKKGRGENIQFDISVRELSVS